MPITPTRFALLGPWPARALLALLLLAIGHGLILSRVPGPGPHLVAAGHSDTALYRAIARDTAAAGGTPAAYYRAAAAEQRARGYPLRPFVTVREPALALATAAIGPRAIEIVYRLLALAALAAVAWRLRAAGSPLQRIAASLGTALAVVLLAQPVLAVWHEAWAALLLVPAIALAGGRRWPLACLAALSAVLVRELAAPVVAALAFAALAEGRRREAAGFALVLALFAGALIAHAHQVAGIGRPGDAISPGWNRLGGWGFILAMLRDASIFSLVPRWLVPVLAPLALVGWTARGSPFDDRVALACFALIVPFMVIGRPDNFYWGLMLAPLLPAGLAFAPRALLDLGRSARQARPRAAWDGGWTADASS